MRDKYIIYTAKLFSMLFAPFYLPVLAFLVLFIFSYMKMLPLNYKLFILALVYIFTVAIPLLGIFAFRRLNGLHRHQMTKREMRTVPYFIFIACYGCCLYLLAQMHMPHMMISILAGAFVIQIVCAFINNWIRHGC